MANQEAVEAIRGQTKWRSYIQQVHKTGDFDFSGADLRGIVSALDKAWANSFNHRLNFTNCTFSDFTVSEIVFAQGADFSGSTFHGRAQFSFQGSTPAGPVTFRNVCFKEPVHIQAAYHQLVIENTVFEKGLQLGGAFYENVEIHGPQTEIRGDLHVQATFHKTCSLKDVRVINSPPPGSSGSVSFRRAVFHGPVTFRNVDVAGVAAFAAAIFEGRTDFRGTIFRVAPIFEKATLNVETEFDVSDDFYRQFPDTKSEGAEQRYRVLKTKMGEHNALSEQQAFARLEMKAYAERHPGKANLYRAYELFSDYGLSWRRPIAWLIGLMLVFAALFIGIGCLEGKSDGVHFAVLALSNAFPFVGALKALQIDAAMVGLSSTAISVVAVLSVIQNVTSTVLLFLIALGIRNRLRMK